MRSENIRIKGIWRFETWGEDGILKDAQEVENLIVNSGLNYLRNYAFFGGSPTSQDDPMNYIALGSDPTTVTAVDVGLGAEVDRLAFATLSEGGTGVVTVSATFTGITGTVAEAGIFNDVSAGDLFNRVTFSGVALSGSDSFKSTCAITFTAA